MKSNSILLKNEEAWLIDGLEQDCVTHLTFESDVNDKVELLYISIPENSFIEIDQPIDAPNLNMLMIEGQASQPFIDDFKGYFREFPDLRSIAMVSTLIPKIPDLILQSKNLESLSFRHENLDKIPEELFGLNKLQTLAFEYAQKIKCIPDDIKKLINLEAFILWASNLEYISPELFRLPKLRRANFTYCKYTPSHETETALQNWLSREDKPDFTSWNN